MLSFSCYISEEFDAKLDYHQQLNPALWENAQLKPKVRAALLKIARQFSETLKIDPKDIQTVILTGSNANYNWTSLSDVDVHVVVDFDDVSKTSKGVDADEYLWVKKTIWNEHHDISIYGYNVEVYAQHSDQPIASSAGVYDLVQDRWVQKPVYKEVHFDDNNIKLKAEKIMAAIDKAIDNKVEDMISLKKISARIVLMRKNGLQKGGEYSVENLAFKALRNNGYLDKFFKYMESVESKNLSLV